MVLVVAGRIALISSPLWLNDFYLKHLPREAGELRLILDVLVYICWQSSLIYLAYRAGWFSLADLGISFVNPLRQTLQGLLILLMVFAILLVLLLIRAALNKAFGMNLPGPHAETLPLWHAGWVFLYTFYLAVTAGIYEEVVYRGIVLAQLRKLTQNRFILVCASALVFSAIHWSLGLATLILAFFLGAFWAALFISQNRLIPVMIAHFLFDYITINGYHLPLLRFIGMDR